MAMTSDQMWAAIHALPWKQGKTTSPTSTPTTQPQVNLASLTAPAPTTTAVPQVSNPVTSTTTTSPYKAYDPNGGTQAFKDTWGNNYTYRMPDGSVRNPAQSWESALASAAKKGSNAASLTSIMKPYWDKQYSDWTNVLNRRNNNAIYKQLVSDPIYSSIANKGLNQEQAAETIAGKLAGYGISNLNEIGTTPDGKFYSKLTGKEIPKNFGYTTWGDGMNKFYLQATPDGRVVPTSSWKETGMSTGGILGTLAAVGGGLAAPWAIPAISGSLGLGSIAAGGLYGAGTGAISSGLSGGNILNGALTGGITGAIGGGILDSVASPTSSLPDVSSLNSGLDISNVDNLIQSGSITSGQGASSLINAAPIGTNITGVAGGALNPALSAGTGALSNLATSDLASVVNNFQSPSSISPVGETPAINNTGTNLSDVSSGNITNLGTDMITSPENLQQLTNTNLGSELLPGTPGTTGGYLNPTMAAGSGTAAVAQSANFSVPEFLSNLFNTGATNFMKDPLKNSTTLLGGLISYLQGQGQSDDLAKLLKQGLSQSDPFGSQRAYYAQRLKDTYTNPVGVQKSPEYQAVHARELEALERADAAQGRRSQYGARAEKMDQNFMEYLNKERATLAGLAGSGISPSQVSDLTKTLGVGSSNAQINSTGQLLFALDQILNGK